jgi:branched-subunit amino acid transport protein
MRSEFLIYLLVMAGVTYLLRLLPMLLIRRRITNRFILSFLYYIPYTVLAVMTVPAVFYATSSPISAMVGALVAVVLAFFGKGLVTVASFAALSCFAAELILMLIK